MLSTSNEFIFFSERAFVPLRSYAQVVDRRQLRPHDELAFVREVACLQRCGAHPGVLSLFEDYPDPYGDGGSDGGGVVSELKRHYLVTELLGGGDLFDRVVRD